jgi:AAA+ superfamily predicted ATPase
MKSITDKIRAGYPGVYLTTFEEQRAESMLKGIADSLQYCLHAWSCTTGRVDTRTGQEFGEQDPTEVLAAVHAMPEKSVLLLRDFHLVLKDPNPVIYRMVKDALLHAKTANKTIVILSPVLELPVELSKLFVVEDFKLPDRSELQVVLENLCTSTGKPLPVNGTLDAVLDASMGLTTTEAEDAFALSLIESGTFSPSVISREKASAVKKNGLLEIIESPVKPEDIGGLEILKEDLLSKRRNFTRAAREYGLQSPRGILAVGQAGTGKSLTSQACGNIFNIPLIKLEAGVLFGSLVGQSEANWRTAFATAKAVAPCVLWLDEAEALFCGGKSSGTTDGGTTNRVVKAVLQDMQFNSDGIFWVFTANDIDGFPDALIDRLDVWSVDLPTQAEREAIWKIHIAKRKRDPKAFDIAAIAEVTAGFSGRQIEQVWLKAMTLAFSDEMREPTNADCLTAAAGFTATSVTMADSIENRRRRLAGKAKAASLPEASTVKPTTNTRKLAV